MQTAILETPPAVIEARYAIQERRLRFIDFVRSIEIHTRQIQSDEEGSKGLLKKLSRTMAALQGQVYLYSDSNGNESLISAAIQNVKDAVIDLRTLDARLSWSVGLVVASCDSFQRVLAEKFPRAKRVEQMEPAAYNPKRMQLLDMVDDLSAKLLTLGDLSHGGLSERRPAIAKAGDLRRAVHEDLTANLSDSPKLAGMVRDVMQAVADLGSMASQATGQVGFMRASMPAINRQCEAILSMLAGSAPPMRPRGLLSIKP